MRFDGERKFGFEVGDIPSRPEIPGKLGGVEQTDVTRFEIDLLRARTAVDHGNGDR